MSDEGEELRAIGVTLWKLEHMRLSSVIVILPSLFLPFFFWSVVPFLSPLVPSFIFLLSAFLSLLFSFHRSFLCSLLPFLFPLKLQRMWGASRDSQNLRKVLDITLFCKCIVHGLPPGKFLWVLFFPLHDNTCKKGKYIAWLSQPEKIGWFGLPAKRNYEKHVQYNAASAGTANAILDVI